MTIQVNLYEAKTQLSRLVDQAAGGEKVIIARNGRPVAALGPLPKHEVVRRTPGDWKGKGWIAPDFDETPDEVVDLFYGDSR
ncbi:MULTISPECIES: type II toxin-antitoxin system Phd/YefM family antitoxin [Actinoalloteichus]|uniref:Antitoxin n=1 Tax=Actinoalloteichus fjordicus TaxID=1612552 RepID=A0AAC9L9V9_9PSEU|nr:MULTISPECIES: type II toxin-antitoxin system prevent-host-death family antitoxin [Actinoalloteichus]APU13873.1 prevent-host-death family protein [Actinoalloteichus fjordicus]APU19819.1 prevent-host-death family protein [Actinoalloteichus sp. GBA129-24]